MNEHSPAPEKELLQTLGGAPAILARLVRSIPRERLEVRRRPHFWTIRDHVSHLAEVQPMLMKRLERFRDESEPSFIPYLPSDQEVPADAAQPLQIDDALAAFSRARAQQIELIDALPEAVWSKSGVHPEFELYTASILVRHIAMHDHWHMYRVEELWITRDAYLTEVS